MTDLSDSLAELFAGLTFFHQVRVDGGVRRGIMLGMSTVFERFEIGGEEYDPSLVWSVDLRCTGPSLPSNPDDAKAWLLSHSEIIRDGFLRYAEQLGAGSDPTGIYLLEWSDFNELPPGVSMKIVCGALRRIDALYLSKRIRFVGEHWERLVGDLEPSFREAY
jgi:hypothetical protein